MVDTSSTATILCDHVIDVWRFLASDMASFRVGGEVGHTTKFVVPRSFL